MPVVSRSPVPPEDTVISLCPAKVQIASAGHCTGLTPDAIRVDPDGVSVTWVEYFPEPPPAIQSAALQLKRTRKPSGTGVLARARVARVLEVTTKLGLSCTVTHTPLDENEAHASIVGCPDNLPVRLALTRAFQEFIPNRSILGFFP